MAFEFGDKILWMGKPAVYLHGDLVKDGGNCWISTQDGIDANEHWVKEDEIIHVMEVSSEANTAPLRDNLVFLHGLMSSFMFHVNPDCSDNFGYIVEEYRKILRSLLPDYN